MDTSLKNPIFTALRPSPLKSPQTQIPNFIICARKRRPPLNRKASKLILDTALIVASNLNVIPPPVTSLIREFRFGGGNGGGFGSRRGGGGGGFGWWRRRARVLGFVLLLVVIGMGLGVGMNERNVIVLSGFGLALVVGLVGCWDMRIGDLVLGFCSCAGIVSLLGLQRVEVSRLVEKVRACVTDLGIMKLPGKRGFKSRPF